MPIIIADFYFTDLRAVDIHLLIPAFIAKNLKLQDGCRLLQFLCAWESYFNIRQVAKSICLPCLSFLSSVDLKQD